jgi:hypothetical protein
MVYIQTHVLAILGLSFVALSSQEGINCKGSGACPIFNADNPDVAVSKQIQNAIWSIPDSRVYKNGQHIACVPGNYIITIPPQNIPVTVFGGICAFLQNSPDKNSRDLKWLIDNLVGHNCKACGSVPVTYPGDNDIKNGMLTLNFVDGEHCDGVC